MSTNELVIKLKEEAASNPFASAVFHIWAMRKRTRAVVTIHGLSLTMKKEGFNFKREEYPKLLKTLSSFGLGSLDLDFKGRVRALKNIKVTLQSIGAAACGQSSELDKFSPQNTFTRIVPKPTVLKQPSSSFAINLEFSINDKVVHIPVPSNLTTEELAILIKRMQ